MRKLALLLTGVCVLTALACGGSGKAPSSTPKPSTSRKFGDVEVSGTPDQLNKIANIKRIDKSDPRYPKPGDIAGNVLQIIQVFEIIPSPTGARIAPPRLTIDDIFIGATWYSITNAGQDLPIYRYDASLGKWDSNPIGTAWIKKDKAEHAYGHLDHASLLAIAETTEEAVAENQPPTRLVIDPSSDTVEPGETVKLYAAASDPDDGPQPLRFTWSANGGQFSDPESNETLWYAPSEPGKYIVNVDVSDGADQSTTRLTITVLEPASPAREEVITEWVKLIIEAYDPEETWYMVGSPESPFPEAAEITAATFGEFGYAVRDVPAGDPALLKEQLAAATAAGVPPEAFILFYPQENWTDMADQVQELGYEGPIYAYSEEGGKPTWEQLR